MEDPQEPERKRLKLADTTDWIERALAGAERERRRMGLTDPSPLPLPTLPSGHSELRPLDVTTSQNTPTQTQRNAPHRFLSPANAALASPIVPVGFAPRRPSSTYTGGGSTPTHSPAPSQATVTSTGRARELSPLESSTAVSVGSGWDTGAGSAALNDSTATFQNIHKVPQVILSPREATRRSKFEQIPKQVFMRIMMYCGYKEQVLLRQCNYNFYHSVDLDLIPWQKKTETILSEERDNPKNFPKKEMKTHVGGDDGDNDDDGAMSDEQAASAKKRPVQGRKKQSKSDQPEGKQMQTKTKAHPDALGKWGCYCCYKILPAQYFEGRLLEDKEGRSSKNQKKRGGESDADKKVDMRVEYVQVLSAVPGQDLPGWLTQDEVKVEATEAEEYVRESMNKGVNCDDLRKYYKDISRETHLVTPLRGVHPSFTLSTAAIPRAPRADLAPQSAAVRNNHNTSSVISTIIAPRSGAERLSTISAAREQPPPPPPPTAERDETFRPLYKIRGHKAPRGDMEEGSYTYEIRIPRGSQRDRDFLTLPESEPVSRICLPGQKRSPFCDDDLPDAPRLEVGDVVSLRRVCIPCGSKFSVYRRDCNRKVISKTEEAWWVCDCPEVRHAGRSLDCPTCGRKVVY